MIFIDLEKTYDKVTMEVLGGQKMYMLHTLDR